MREKKDNGKGIHGFIFLNMNGPLAIMHFEINDIFIALSALMQQPATEIENSSFNPI